jgi:molybdopterin converting factor subunit 1
MIVTLLYFAALRDLLGKSEERIELPDSVVTVGDLSAHLALREPALAPRMKHVRIARNEAFAAMGERLRDGDVVALIPPVAGG